MSTSRRVLTLPGGMLIMVGGEAGAFCLEGYRPVEKRRGGKTLSTPMTRPTGALASRRFATIGEIASALQRALAK